MTPVYLHLFHGRETVDADMDDWGFNGPTIGPLDYAHTTYANDIKLGIKDAELCAKFGLDPHFPALAIVDGLVVYGGKFYGDWSVSTERATGFYEIRMATPGHEEGTTSGTLNLTLHDALELFERERENSPELNIKLHDVGSSEPYLVKEIEARA